MSIKIALALLAVAHSAAADSSHPLRFAKVDAQTAHNVAAAKGRVDANGNAPLFAEQGFWFSHFTVGASPDLQILIDTGSSDAILNPGVYKPSSGSTDTHRPFHISYATTNPDGSGELSASGNVYNDVVTQHGANLTVKQQAIGDITNPKSKPTFPHDGLVGYGSANDAALGASPFFHSLCSQKSLSACRFGLALKTDNTGTLYYGTVATDQFSGPLVSVPIAGEWTASGDITLNGKAFASRQQIITDSGTTVFFGPTDTVRNLFQKAGVKVVQLDSGVVTGHYDCSSPPTIGINFGGTNFNILAAAQAFEKNGNDCTSTIHGTDAFGDAWLVGQSFFQGRYIDHNVDDRTMGFANLK